MTIDSVVDTEHKVTKSVAVNQSVLIVEEHMSSSDGTSSLRYQHSTVCSTAQLSPCINVWSDQIFSLACLDPYAKRVIFPCLLAALMRLCYV